MVQGRQAGPRRGPPPSHIGRLTQQRPLHRDDPRAMALNERRAPLDGGAIDAAKAKAARTAGRTLESRCCAEEPSLLDRMPRPDRSRPATGGCTGGMLAGTGSGSGGGYDMLHTLQQLGPGGSRECRSTGCVEACVAADGHGRLRAQQEWWWQPVLVRPPQFPLQCIKMKTKGVCKRLTASRNRRS